jgi:hypothetical protein
MSMQEETRSVIGSALEASARPLSLLIATIRDVGGKDDKQGQHKRTFLRLLNDVGYEDFRDAVLDEWFRIKYTTALSAANPPTTAEIKARRERQKQEANEAQNQVNNIKLKIMNNVLDMVMANGKKLSECTGAECLRMGGWLTRIGESVGPKRLVGDVLSQKDIIKLVR